MRLQSSDIPSNYNKKEKKLDPSLTENCAVKGESGDAIQNIKCSEHKEGPRKPLTSKRQKVMDFESSSTTTLVDLTAESQEKSSGRTKDSRPLKADIDVSDDDILSTMELIHILYPNPSHILTEDISSCTGKQLFLMDQSYHRPIISSTTMESITDDTPINLDLNSSCNRAPQCSSIMYEVLSSIFDRSHSIASDTDMVNWSEKYRIQNIPKDVCGSSNIEAAEKMIEFIENWRIHRQSAIDTRNEKVKEMLGIKRKKESSKKRQVYASDDDDDYLSDDDVGGLPTVLLLTGPTGSGKTSLVHAVATKCQCVVLEVNSTMKRSGQAVKNIIEESTQSHSNLALLKVGISQEVDEICIEENIASKDNGVASLSLVLIDEGMFREFFSEFSSSLSSCVSPCYFVQSISYLRTMVMRDSGKICLR
jgi:predicted ATPase